MYKPNTLKDIADGLGLSVSTVSRALSDNYQISEKTKRRVNEEAIKINFKRNPFARSLKSVRNYSLGVIVSSVNNPFFSQVIDGIESVAYKNGYHVIITQTHESSVREAENIRHLMESRVDGILLSLAAGTKNYSHILEYQRSGNPIVFFDRVMKDGKSHKVVSDNFKGAYQGTTQLIRGGCQKILFLGSVYYLSIIEQRRLGYQQALINNDIQVEESLIRYCGCTVDYANTIENILIELMNSDHKPDAIFTACENSTFGSLQALKKLKLENEIKVVGFSNTDVSDLINPLSNFIKQSAFTMGCIATSQLIRSIENERSNQNYETITLETILGN
jgi:LacI family transcriptional regulator|nr:LacI family DNA-binding transcriptional regulator [uncultured Pedobacter sp.]